jgi:hypothetical protein
MLEKRRHIESMALESSAVERKRRHPQHNIRRVLRTARRLVSQAVLVLAWCLPLSAQQATVIRNANLRPTPSADGTSRQLLEPPATLTLISTKPTSGYYHVRTEQNTTGWVWARNISIAEGNAAPVSSGGSGNENSSTTSADGAFAVDNVACPAVGEHSVNQSLVPYADTSDGGLRNLAKRHLPTGASPFTLTLSGFGELQQVINTTFADAHHTKTLFHPSRNGLKNLPFDGTTVSEGQLVQLAGYLVAVRAEGKESVNCAGQDGFDFHLNIGEQGATEWEGVVVEMIPQLGHPVGWDTTTLGQVRDAHLQVLVVGGLTYDNEHLVNDDPAHPNGTQPKRIALWEIHPVTEFYVCAMTTCDPAQRTDWTSLTAWAEAHRP